MYNAADKRLINSAKLAETQVKLSKSADKRNKKTVNVLFFQNLTRRLTKRRVLIAEYYGNL